MAVGMETVRATDTTAADPDNSVEVAARCANRVVRLEMDVDGRLVGLVGFLVATGRTIRLGDARDARTYLKVVNGDGMGHCCTAVFFGSGPGGVQL